MRRFLIRLYTFFRADRAERDLRREVEAHLALLEDDFRQRGLSNDDARRAARRAFGGVESAKAQQRDARSFVALEDARRDVRYAARALLRAPGFTAAAVSTIAIGIGASTAIFSVAYGVSLRPLPYADPGRLVRIYEAHPGNGKLKEDVSEGAFNDWREGAGSIESAAIYDKPATRFLAGPGATAVVLMGVSPAFFDVLGARLLMGPGFKPEREYTRFTTHDLVLSHAAWQRLLGGRADAVGQTIELTGVGDNDSYRVVGVMPPDFAFLEAADAWYPHIVEVPVPRLLRQWRYDRVVARLRAGATVEQLRAELVPISARQQREFPTVYSGWTVTVESLHESVVGNFGRATWLLLAAVAVVLLVTSLNVGGLLVARAVARGRETAVRVALGAGGWRLARLWLMEASLIAGSGAALGLLVAWAAVSALTAAAPPGIPRLEAIAIDLPALGIAGVAALVAVLFFTLAPLRALPRRDVVEGLRATSVQAGERTGRGAARAALTLVQCAGAACLVVLAFMLTRSFVKLTSFDLGWEPAGVLSESLSPPVPRELRRPWYRYVEWSDRLIARLEATPGIDRAAITTQIPFSPLANISTLARGRRTKTDDERWPGVQHIVSDHYFEVMGIRLRSGRSFSVEDRFTEAQLLSSAANERGVVVVSESTARALWPGRSPLGEALWLPDIDTVKWREVVGVVEDIQFYAIGETPALHVFVPFTQTATSRPRLVVKASMPPAELTASVRQIVEQVEPGTRVENIATLDSIVARATAQPRFTARIVSGFGLVALLVAAVGIYGTLSYVVAARTREIGIRLALGASRRSITTSIVVGGVLPSLAGGLLGTGLAVVLAAVFRSMFFETPPLDSASIAGGVVLLLLVSLAAAAGPALRAARVDPILALRAD